MKFYVCYFRVNGETSILKLPPVTTNLLNSLSAKVLNPLLTLQSVKLFELRNAAILKQNHPSNENLSYSKFWRRKLRDWKI
jgi:hypothetical protein